MSKIKIINGFKEYVKNKEKISILENININFEEGKFYAIMGNSGVGKTTLLNILGTLDTLTSGEMLIDDVAIMNLKEDQKAEIRMKKIGFIFQEFYLNKYLNIEENIIQPMYINKEYNKESRNKKVNKLIEMVGLSNRKKHYPGELSGGEQQRVAIARALANNPDIILADEPTGNLDKANQKNVFDLLKSLSKAGKCIIVVSHSEKIKEYADIVMNLKEGCLEINEN